MKISIDDIKHKVVPILKKARVKKASLFGSYIRGEQHENSDVDILVDFPIGLTLFDIGGIKMDLEDALGKKVDLVQYHKIKSSLKQYILSEQIQII